MFFFGRNNKWFEVEQILTKASFMWLALRRQSFAHQPHTYIPIVMK